MFPKEKNEAVMRALRTTFGAAGIEDLRLLSGGGRADLIFRIVVQGSPFLLRIIRRTDDPVCHFTCMQAAADAGLAPQVLYTSVEDRICITGFVNAVPLSPQDALVRLPAALRTLHALPPFPARAAHLNTTCTFLLNEGPARDKFIQGFQASDVLPSTGKEKFLDLYANIVAAYSGHNADMVSSHNDLLKPDNILFDGERVWLVDWEAAFLNNRYVDLASVANFVLTGDDDERIYLQQYFGQPPTPYQQACFFLIRQLTHIFYAMAFLLLGSAGKPVRWTEDLPDFKDFHRRLWTGELNIRDSHVKVDYGKVHWQRLMENVRHPRFAEALKVVSATRAHS